jgi:hypothetical protein
MTLLEKYPTGGALKNFHVQSLRKRIVVIVAPLVLAAGAAAAAPFALSPPTLSCHGDTPGFCPSSPFGESPYEQVTQLDS